MHWRPPWFSYTKKLLLLRPFLQVTELLFNHVWGQWCTDTQALLASLPGGLESLAVGQPLLPSFERWMLLLKVRPRLRPSGAGRESGHAAVWGLHHQLHVGQPDLPGAAAAAEVELRTASCVGRVHRVWHQPLLLLARLTARQGPLRLHSRVSGRRRRLFPSHPAALFRLRRSPFTDPPPPHLARLPVGRAHAVARRGGAQLLPAPHGSAAGHGGVPAGGAHAPEPPAGHA